jgi:alcohol dehydrogenase class IV
MKLADIGMPADGLERAARIATESPYPNPRPPAYEEVLEVLQAAYQGRRPA